MAFSGFAPKWSADVVKARRKIYISSPSISTTTIEQAEDAAEFNNELERSEWDRVRVGQGTRKGPQNTAGGSERTLHPCAELHVTWLLFTSRDHISGAREGNVGHGTPLISSMHCKHVTELLEKWVHCLACDVEAWNETGRAAGGHSSIFFFRTLWLLNR